MVVAFFIEGRGMPNANLAAMKAKGYLQTKDKKIKHNNDKTIQKNTNS